MGDFGTQRDRLKSLVKEIADFLDTVKFLSNAHTSDFIVRDLWENFIPGPLQTELFSLTSEELLNLPYHVKPTDQPPPTPSSVYGLADLRQYLNVTSSLRLDNLTIVHSLESFYPYLQMTPTTPRRLKGYMKEKKSHEIDIISALCADICKHREIRDVCDVGSGRGYLGAHLAMLYGLSVLGIDSSQTNTRSAEQRAARLTKHIRSAVRTDTGRESEDVCDRQEDCRGTHINVTEFITEETDLCQLYCAHVLDSNCGSGEPVTSQGGVPERPERDIMLTGLHTCGNLGANIVKFFAAELFVPAEYEATEIARSPEPPAFPLSSVLRERGFWLGRNARMLAAQSPDRIAHNKQIPTRALFWRALLQVLLRDVRGEVRADWRVGRIAAKCENFVQYVHTACRKLNIEHGLSEEDVARYEERYAHAQRQIACLYQLRLCLAPVVEGLIALDRLLYLTEQLGVESAQLLRLFDPVISPRCHALVAFKQPK